MHQHSARAALVLGLLLSHVTAAHAQQTTYHLHKEPTDDFFFCGYSLKDAPPDAPGFALQSPDLKNHATGTGTFACFETFPNAPSLGGTIPASSTVTFTVWMKKTADWGVIFPWASLQLASGTTLCFQAGGTALSRSQPQNPFTFSCTTPATPIAITTNDRFKLYVGYSITTPPGNHSVKVELDIETGFDSQVRAPNPVPPQITLVNPNAAPPNWSVTISGTNFTTTPGTVKFNTTAATVSNWSDTSITAVVPSGMSPGAASVSVSVGGAISTSVPFTVLGPPVLTSVAPNPAHRGDAVTLTGTNFMTPQAGSTVTFNDATATVTNWMNTNITATVPPTATTGLVFVTVAGQHSNTLPFTVLLPGTISGKITKTADATPLQGATIQAVLTGIIKGTATSAANGTYSVSNLDPGTYDVRVLASTYASEVRSAMLANGGTTTIDVALWHPGTIAGQVTAGGTTPLAGAAVTMFLDGVQRGSTSTDGAGNYTIAGLHPGSYTLQVVDVGYRTKEQNAVVTDNATTTLNVSLDAAPAGPVLYAYDALGRLVQVTDAAGDSAIYRYDAVGNITGIERPGSSAVAISGLSLTSGPIGTAVTVYGSGFGTTQGASGLTFNGTSASPTSWSSTAIVTTVPAAATSGPVVVTVNGVSSNGAPFTVTAATSGPPTITGFTPTLVVAGNTITVSGTNFETTPANDRLAVNLATAQVTAASDTSMQATVPVTTTGKLTVSTQTGNGTSADYLWVAPPPYTVAQVNSTGSLAFRSAVSIPVTTANAIALRAFEGTRGHRASASVSNGTFSAGGRISIYGVYGNPISTNFAGNGFLEPVDLTATGTYTFVLAPNSPGTGSATVTVYDVPADVTPPIVPGGSSIPVDIEAPGQNGRLPFAGAQNHRVCATTAASTTIPSGILRVLRPDGTTLGSVGFLANFLGFLDTLSLATTGTYTLMVDPNTTNIGTTTVTLYDVPADTTGAVTIGGPAVPVPLAACQNASLTFTGTQNQQVVVHVTGNSTGESVLVKLLSSDGTTVLSQALSGAVNFDLLPATLPAAGTTVYTITIDPSRIGAGSLNISVTLQ